MTRSAIAKRTGLGAAAVTLVWAGLVGGSVPARAFDDKPSSLDPILNFVGLGKDDDEKPQIDFRERPALVVPKSTDLPPPQAGGSQRATNWPVDQDVARQRAAKAAARAPRVINPNANPVLSKSELDQGRSDDKPTSPEICDTRQAGVPDCSALTPVDKLKQVFSLGEGPVNKDVSTPGYEPDRQYLTEPPKGYRAPRTVVEVKQRTPNKAYEAPSASDYARGVDPNRPTDAN